MGLVRIADAFAAARAEGRAALMPYFTLGYPDADTSEAVIRAIAAAGADLIELGVPFSDPLADGPTIQRSTQVALEGGMTVARCLALTSRLREAGVSQALLLMGYVNPILAYGAARFVADAAAAGADGLIIPDLPPEEAAAGGAGEIEAACAAHGLALVYLAAPTSTDERVATLAARTTGFLYLVSVAGVTGARRWPAARPRRVRRTCARRRPNSDRGGLWHCHAGSGPRRGPTRRWRDRRLGADQRSDRRGESGRGRTRLRQRVTRRARHACE